jgi:hypothetical protein
MQKYPSGTIYRRPFPNKLARCTSLPYGTLKAETASMLATRSWLKELAKEIFGKSIYS